MSTAALLSVDQIETLVRKAQRGDEESFARLFEQFYDRINRYVSFKVPPEDIEDLVSEVF